MEREGGGPTPEVAKDGVGLFLQPVDARVVIMLGAEAPVFVEPKIERAHHQSVALARPFGKAGRPCGGRSAQAPAPYIVGAKVNVVSDIRHRPSLTSKRVLDSTVSQERGLKARSE